MSLCIGEDGGIFFGGGGFTLFLDAANGMLPNIYMFLIRIEYLWMVEQQRGKSAISSGPPPAQTARGSSSSQISITSCMIDSRI